MEGFFSFILITVLVIWLIGQVGRFFLRRFVKRAQRNFSQQFGEGQQGGYHRQYTWGADRDAPLGKEGDVKVTGDSSEKKKVSKKVGEYVDYEDV